jgi:Transposase DDE domain group 1
VRVNATTSLSRMEVTCDMPGLTSRAGSALLSGLADAIGLTDGLVSGLSVHSRAVRHEPGRVVRDLAVMLADGGDCLTDMGALRDQGVLLGEVASDATAYRCVERLDAGMLAQIREARAAARARAWGLGEAPRRLVFDIDATLLTGRPPGCLPRWKIASGEASRPMKLTAQSVEVSPRASRSQPSPQPSSTTRPHTESAMSDRAQARCSSCADVRGLTIVALREPDSDRRQRLAEVREAMPKASPPHAAIGRGLSSEPARSRGSLTHRCRRQFCFSPRSSL